jgi:hypothetical protein
MKKATPPIGGPKAQKMKKQLISNNLASGAQQRLAMDGQHLRLRGNPYPN